MITMQAIPLFATATQFIAEALKKNLGVNVDVQVVDPATYVAKAVGGYGEKAPKEWELFVAWELSLQSIPDYNALAHYIPTGYGAIFGNLRPDSPNADTAAYALKMLSLWNAQAQELNPETRKQKMVDLQRAILDSYGPAVPLPVAATAYQPYRDRVKNFPVNDFMYSNSGAGSMRVQDMYLEG
jgi:ABC-type transport system substrate-binding protein